MALEMASGLHLVMALEMVTERVSVLEWELAKGMPSESN